MTDLTPEAEVLRKKLDHLTYQGCHVPIDERVGAVARTIVEELGLSWDMLQGELGCETLTDDFDWQVVTAVAVRSLLELAGVKA